MQGYPGQNQEYAYQPQPGQDQIWPQLPQQYAAPYADPYAAPQYAQQPQAPHYAPVAGGWPQGVMPVSEPISPRAATTGGKATTLSSRTRWFRVIGVLVGVALLSFAVYNFVSQGGLGSTTKDSGSAARDAGALADSAGADSLADKDTTIADVVETPEDAAVATPTPAPTAAETAAAAIRKQARRARLEQQRARRQAARRKASAAVLANGSGVAAAASGSGTVRGGGANSLPYTGAEHWIAAMLGVLLLGAGLAFQLNAARIGESASLYQRGPLLRPFDAVRDAFAGTGSAGGSFGRLVQVLTQPSGDSDYVTARRRH